MTNNELKVILEKHITNAIDEITSQDNELGWIGGDLSSLATDAAFAVIMASASGSNAAEEAEKD